MLPSSVIPRKKFYMVRHGETEDNKQHIVSGADAELSEEGVQQGKNLDRLVKTMWESPSEQCYLVTSKMTRARRTTGFGFQGITPHPDHRLNELGTGQAGGKVVVGELYKYADEALDIPKDELEVSDFNGHTVTDVNGSSIEFDHAETNQKHQRRVLKALREHLDSAPENQDAVFVSHKLTMGRVADALGLPFDDFKNATIYEIEPEGRAGWKMRECSLDHEGQVHKRLIAQTNIPIVGGGVAAPTR